MVLIYDIPYLTHIVLVICSHGIAMGILYNICAYFSNKLDYKTFFKNSLIEIMLSSIALKFEEHVPL